MKITKRATIYDIAAALNKTPATVSRALSGNTRISAATRKEVTEMAKKLNYQPNVLAHTLRTGSAKTIGIIVPDITNNFFAKIIAGIEEVASQNKYTTIICQTHEELNKEQHAIDTLLNQYVACILFSHSAETAKTGRLEHMQKALSHNTKLIQFDRTNATLNTDCVINDIENVMEEVVRHFIDQGYKRIGFIAGPQEIDIFEKRKTVLEKQLQQFAPSLKLQTTFFDLTRESSRAAARKLLSAKKRPDVILASTDLGALGVWDTAKEMQLRIPDDLALCGFSNEFYTELVTPNITSVNQRGLEMGQAAASIFFERNKDPKAGRSVIVLKPELMIRESTTRK
jgi:LacI family transcriptional regulator, repressor for deo operon, udp, cdd, tsx, nupC, and nupG